MHYRIQTTIFPDRMTLEVQCEPDGEWETVCEIREIAPDAWTAHSDAVKSVSGETLDRFCEMLARRFLKQNLPIAHPATHQMQLL
jgi:hypothetical protein